MGSKCGIVNGESWSRDPSKAHPTGCVCSASIPGRDWAELNGFAGSTAPDSVLPSLTIRSCLAGHWLGCTKTCLGFLSHLVVLASTSQCLGASATQQVTPLRTLGAPHLPPALLPMERCWFLPLRGPQELSPQHAGVELLQHQLLSAAAAWSALTRPPQGTTGWRWQGQDKTPTWQGVGCACSWNTFPLLRCRL